MKQHDDSSKGSFSSGGQRIDNHKFWAGGPSHGSVFPDGGHKIKDESSAQGAGSLTHYEDTTAAIKESQEEGIRKVKGHPLKSNYRN
jgi:hypothetical protein